MPILIRFSLKTLPCKPFIFIFSDWTKNSAKGIDGVVVDLYDTSFLHDELLGSVLIPRSNLIPNKFEKRWFPIDLSEAKNALVTSVEHAELLLEVMFIETEGWLHLIS